MLDSRIRLIHTNGDCPSDIPLVHSAPMLLVGAFLRLTT